MVKFPIAWPFPCGVMVWRLWWCPVRLMGVVSPTRLAEFFACCGGGGGAGRWTTGRSQEGWGKGGGWFC